MTRYVETGEKLGTRLLIQEQTMKRYIFGQIFVLSAVFEHVLMGNYSDTLTFINDRLGSANYNTQIRPVINQSHVIKVDVVFELVSIVEVNDVTQSFTCNGFLIFNWTDELLAWNETETRVQEMIHPLPENIWRPRVILMNTLEDRDLFDDDKAPVFISNKGRATWVPGSLFPTSCSLDLTYYPFDEQTCAIALAAMTYSEAELKFSALQPNARRGNYVDNGEWDLKSTQVFATYIDAKDVNLSSIQVRFVMKRRSTFFLVNVLLPVVFLSFLNIFVFVIPAESGEKIGYGITVLLSLSVYMSTVSGMLPRSSLTLPNVIIYLFILLILSMITVISSIIIVVINSLEEKQDIQMRAQDNFSTALSKVKVLLRAVSAMKSSDKFTKIRWPHFKANSDKPGLANDSDQTSPRPRSDQTSHTPVPDPATDESVAPLRRVNRYKLIGRHINMVLFLVFLCIYIAITLGFIMKTAFP
ncbi:Acetylcholine receptor subunit beta-like 1 [Bulinus truncatus]|nr:Acetylcholine receptor subunit beta-like 1 [Bulinus truncatus]